MNTDFLMSLDRPELYKKSKSCFWNDEHISKQMLAAHLDADFEGASRKLDFIAQSVHWIEEIVPPRTYNALLDIGCGPGLYTERFCQAGYTVTGLDFSKRSIDHAKKSADQQSLDITYVYQDYLTMEYHNLYDLVTLIYCDYGALSAENRKILLQKIYYSLKDGGRLLLDVFSMVQYTVFEENKTWKVYEYGGFWSPKKHLSMNARYKYENHITLEQTIVVTSQDVKEYCIWNCCFTLERLVKEMSDAGFQVVQVFGDVAGRAYEEESPTIAILLEK